MLSSQTFSVKGNSNLTLNYKDKRLNNKMKKKGKNNKIRNLSKYRKTNEVFNLNRDDYDLNRDLYSNFHLNLPQPTEASAGVGF